MSRVGNPYDNAKAESFMKTLKEEHETTLDSPKNRAISAKKQEAVMKNTKKMLSLIGLVAMVCNVNSFAKEKSKAPVNTEVIRSIDWASDANTYPNLQVKAECFQRDAKHFTWQITLAKGERRALS
jgi:transposase InsO family protein